MFFLIKYLIRLWRRRQQPQQPAETEPEASSREPRTRARRVAPAGPSAAARGPLAVLAHELRYDLKTSLRNPRARFVTFLFPVLLLVIFNSAFGGGHTNIAGQQITLARFYVPGIMTLSIVMGSYGMLVQSITVLRETGVLKRRRATPVPPGILIAGQALTTVVTVGITVAILLAVAEVGYGGPGDARLRVRRLPRVESDRLAGGGDARRAGDDAAAVVPLGGVHPDEQPQRGSQGGRGRVPRRARGQQPASRLCQQLVRRRARRHRPARAGRLGARRCGAGSVALQLAAEHR